VGVNPTTPYSNKLLLASTPVYQPGKPHERCLTVEYPPSSLPGQPQHVIFNASADLHNILPIPADNDDYAFAVRIKAFVDAPVSGERSVPIFSLQDEHNNPIIQVTQRRKDDDSKLYVNLAYYPRSDDLTYNFNGDIEFIDYKRANREPDYYFIEISKGYVRLSASTESIVMRQETDRDIYGMSRARFFQENRGTDHGLTLDIYDISVLPHVFD